MHILTHVCTIQTFTFIYIDILYFRPSNERVIKIPDVSSIAEEPELSKNESAASENSTDDVFVKSSEENVALINHDIEMTPVLFVSDARGIYKFYKYIIKAYLMCSFICTIIFRSL